MDFKIGHNKTGRIGTKSNEVDFYNVIVQVN